MALPTFDKLGVFYLGREYDPKADTLGAEVLYDSRDLTTHAICIGMTGSGKTGLCLSLLEEAALDGIPAIAIDPKGDIGNLMLTFPDLAATDFKPWVDAGEAARKGLDVDAFAAKTAEDWRKGLADWGEDGARIARLKAAAEVAIYTPGASAGRGLSILRSFGAPDPAVLADATALKERIAAAVAGLLGLLGIDADPLKSREHLLLSAILDDAWRKGESPDLAALIGAVQKPPFAKLGVFDVDSFYPAKDRTELAMRINGLLAAPGFAAWLDGEPLDIQQLFYTADGKPRLSIVSIGHLNDAERMLVVTLIANELVAWMRKQSGTTSLRALFYMDEIFGYFPPSAMPPSKLPLLTLMKQARAFGLGIVLATQNPVDLDYKGLSNAGTWFIGRLQTERDKARVIEGLLGSQAAEGMDRAGLEAMMASLAQRTFLMRNVHDDAPVLMRTRWALCYLRGPLTLAEVARLQPASTASAAAMPGTVTPATPSAGPAAAAGTAVARRPIVQAGVIEKFGTAPPAGQPYRAHFGAHVRVHFVDAKAGVDAWEDWLCVAPLGPGGPEWSQAIMRAAAEAALGDTPAGGASFAEPPPAALAPRSYRTWEKQLEDHVYRTAARSVSYSAELKMFAESGSSEGEFRQRVAQSLRERRDSAIDALRTKYAAKLGRIEEQLRRSEQKIDRERAQAQNLTTSSVLTVGGSLLGALLGGGRRSSSALRRAGTAARDLGRVSKERADVANAEADANAVREQHDALQAELESEVTALTAQYEPDAIRIETVSVRARKADIAVENAALVWSA